MILQPMDDLRLHQQKEERLQRGHAAALYHDVLQEIAMDEPAYQPELAVSRRVLAWCMRVWEQRRFPWRRKWQKDELWLVNGKMGGKRT